MHMSQKDKRRRKRRLLELYQHCAYCLKPLNGDVTLDHVHPKSLGGRDGLTNLVLAHRMCNRAKSTTPAKVVKKNENGIPLVVRCSVFVRGSSRNPNTRMSTLRRRTRPKTQRMPEALA